MQNLFILFVLVGGCPYQRGYVWGFVSLLSYAGGVVGGSTPAACPRRTVHVTVSPGAAVGDLGLALYDAEGITPRFQALRHASTLPDLLRPLTSYRIFDGSFLDLGGTSVLGGVSPASPAPGELGR